MTDKLPLAQDPVWPPVPMTYADLCRDPVCEVPGPHIHRKAESS